MVDREEIIQKSRQALAEAGIVIPPPLPGEKPLETAIRCSLYVGGSDSEMTRLKMRVAELEKANVGFEIGMKEALQRLSDTEVVQLILETPGFNRQEMKEPAKERPFFPKSSSLFEKVAAFLEEPRCAQIVSAGDTLLSSFVTGVENNVAVLQAELARMVESKTDEAIISQRRAAITKEEQETRELPLRWAAFLASVVNAYPKAFDKKTIDEDKNPLATAVNTPAHRKLWQNQGFIPIRPLNGITWEIANH